MVGRRHLKPALLHPEMYERWLKENPKEVPGGPIELISNSNDINDVYFKAYSISSDELPEHYATNLIIYSTYNKFKKVFCIWVTVDGFDYLLMAHQKHKGPFKSADGKIFKDYPHFHELDFFKPFKKGKPDSRRPVPPSLYSGINSAELLNAFMEYYYIEDARLGSIQHPGYKSNRPRQKRIDEIHE